MNKKLIIIIATVVLVVGAGAAIFINLKNAESPTETNEQSVQTNNASNNTESETSLNKLMQAGKNVKCTFTLKEDDGSSSSGTVFISTNKKMRGDFVSIPQGQPQTESSMIVTDDTQYIWSVAEKKGIKTTISPDQATSSDNSNNNNSNQIDKDKNYDFKCEGWKVDESKFVVPSDVQFTEFNAQLPTTPSGAQPSVSAQACAQIPDASARAQCEQAIQNQSN